MPENNDPTNVGGEQNSVSREDYNKVVEMQNSQKVENEKLKTELETINKAKEAEGAEAAKLAAEKIEADKLTWEKEKVEKDKQIEELKAAAEAKAANPNAVNPKGVVTNPPKDPEQVTQEKVTEGIDKELGKIPEKDPANFANRWAAYGHFKNPQSKVFTDEQFGKALSLHQAALQNNDIELNQFQKSFGKVETKDIVVPRTYGTDNSIN